MDDAAIMLDEEFGPEPLQRLLDAIMRVGVGQLQNVVEDRGGRWDVDAALVEEEAVLQRLVCASRA